METTTQVTTQQTPLQKLTNRHEEIFRLYICAVPVMDIASQLGMSANGVSKVVNSDIGKSRIGELQEQISARFIESRARAGASHMDAREILKGALPTAAQGLVDLMNGAKSERVQQLSCLEILNRNGVSDELKGGTTVNVIVSAKQVTNASRALEEKEQAPTTSEVTVGSMTKATPPTEVEDTIAITRWDKE